LVGLLVSACSATPASTVIGALTATTSTDGAAPASIAALTETNVADTMPVEGQGSGSASAESLDAVSTPLSVNGLTENEAASLLYMREEEKLAHDVYITLFEVWGLPIFQNIANSESSHTAAVLTLLERYGLDDPVTGNPVGVFTDPALQSLYDELTAQGRQSLAEALKVGAAIEEIDILDLEEGSQQTDKADILQVYANLLKGSRNHLRSFVKTLQQQAGETYAPQYMEQAAYDVIIGVQTERGNSGAQAAGGRRGGRP